MDGESVEVIPNDALDDQPTDTNDDGINGNEGDKDKDDGVASPGKEDHGKGGSVSRDEGEGEKMCRACIKGGKGQRTVPCKDKDEDDDGELDEEVDGMTITPDEIAKNKKIRDIIKCDESGKKINICHHPSDDVEKRKTLCVGAAAVHGLVEGRKLNYLGACPEDQPADQDAAE